MTVETAAAAGRREDRVRRRRRPPSLYALAIVVVVTLAGVGLFVWGPVNPNVEVDLADSDGGLHGVGDWVAAVTGATGSFGTSRSVGESGRVETDFVITNHSLASVRLGGVHIETVGTAGTPAPTIAHIRGVPAELGRDAPTSVQVTVDARAWCAAHPGQQFDYRIIFEATTAWGADRTIGHNGRQSFECTRDLLPPAGTPPVDPASARDAITSAFTTAYDFSAAPARRRASVDDPGGLDAMVAAARSGPYASALRDVWVHINEIVFASPTEAAVLYDLVGDHVTYATGRIGHVHLVDGHWKVTRATVCADLALTRTSCPSD